MGLRAAPPVEVEPPGHVPPEGLRSALRASSRYLLRALAGGAAATNGDMLTVAVIVAVMDSNIGHLDNDPQLAVRYAAYDQPPPDGLRKPQSVRAVADRIGAPYETVRRRVEDLVASGRCRRTPAGVYAPAQKNPDHLSGAEANLGAVRRLLQDLRQGAPSGRWPSGELPAPGEQASPVRLLNRRSAAFAIEVLAAAAEACGGYNEALAYLAVIECVGRCGDADVPLRVPVLTLARSLNQPNESIRRRLIRLEARGFIHRDQGGVSADAAPEGERLLGRFAVANFKALHRFFGHLTRLGVLS